MSLSNTAVAVVLQALKGITANPDQCFTAYDVTKAARSLCDENIRHEDVRELLHTFFEQGMLKQYTRQPHNFWHNGRQIDAQLFCPPTGDPFAYDPDEVVMTKPDTDDDEVLLEDEDGDPLVNSQGLVGANSQNIVGATPDLQTSQSPPTPAKPKLDSTDPFELLRKIKAGLTRLPKLW